MDPILAIALPGGALALGLFGFVFNKVSSWSFDRKHPRLSRKGMRAAAARDSDVKVTAISADNLTIKNDMSNDDLEISRALKEAEEETNREMSFEIPAFLRKGDAADTYELNKLYLEKLLRNQVKTMVRDDGPLRGFHPRVTKILPPKTGPVTSDEQSQVRREVLGR